MSHVHYPHYTVVATALVTLTGKMVSKSAYASLNDTSHSSSSTATTTLLYLSNSKLLFLPFSIAKEHIQGFLWLLLLLNTGYTLHGTVAVHPESSQPNHPLIITVHRPTATTAAANFAQYKTYIYLYFLHSSLRRWRTKWNNHHHFFADGPRHENN